MKNFPDTITNSNAKKGKAKSGNLSPLAFNLNKEIKMLDTIGVSIIKARAVNLYNIISLFYTQSANL
ncbi:hypothetical protein AKK44_05715 [Streptococcus phocae]|uniref:Uncharacterized protein n=1 Tax=Streptococcus phocae TaxID=119224 RepID=A0A0N8FX57_9STRE|nr:hypothetical protein AKK44_05715 [Streptococcus phocae]